MLSSLLCSKVSATRNSSSQGKNVCDFTTSFCRNQINVNRVDDKMLYSSHDFPDDKLRNTPRNNCHVYYLCLIIPKSNNYRNTIKNMLLLIRNIQLSDEHLAIYALTTRVELNTDEDGN